MSVKAFYDDFSGEYDAKRFRKRYSRKVSCREKDFVIRRANEDRILEIGAGTGRFTEALISNCQNLVAVDVSSKMLDILRNKIDSSKLEIHNLDLFNLPRLVHYGKFDSVICMRVLPHVEDIEEALRIISIAASEGGNVIFDLWGRDSFIYFARKLLGRKSKAYTRYLKYEEMLKIINQAGLQIVDSIAWGYPRVFSFSLDSIGNKYFKKFGYSIVFNCVRNFSPS
jgi:2-polyprenyl-3-methyl-5-hydroxy-6-metoxy-1,4-benzoquinol methylase